VGSSSSFSSVARREAAHILAQPPFTSKPSAPIPDPLAGVLHAIGRLLSDLGKPLGWLWRHVSSFVHGTFGSASWVVLAALAVGAGACTAWLLIRRRARVEARPARGRDELPRGDAGALDAAAAAAEARGDLDAAVRLRFRAGLARLEAAGIIASQLVTTTQQVRQTLHNPTFDHLAERHEAIAYAGRSASNADAAQARESWPRLLDEVRAASSKRESP